MKDSLFNNQSLLFVCPLRLRQNCTCLYRGNNGSLCSIKCWLWGTESDCGRRFVVMVKLIFDWSRSQSEMRSVFVFVPSAYWDAHTRRNAANLHIHTVWPGPNWIQLKGIKIQSRRIMKYYEHTSCRRVMIMYAHVCIYVSCMCVCKPFTVYFCFFFLSFFLFWLKGVRTLE